MNQFLTLTVFCRIMTICVIYCFSLTPFKYCQADNGQIIIVLMATDKKTYLALECGPNNLANYPGM